MEKTYKIKVLGHTPGALKCNEVDANGNKTIEVQGACYLRKSAVGNLPIGTIIEVTIKVLG